MSRYDGRSPEFDAQGQFLQETLRTADGELVSYTVYHYDRDGYLLELVTTPPMVQSPAGKMLEAGLAGISQSSASSPWTIPG